MANRTGKRWLNRRRVRFGVRVVCLVAAVAALWPALGWWASPVIVGALSPLLAAAAVLATWTVQGAMLLGACVGAASLRRRRWFCHWMCPTGLCADTASRLGMRVGRRCPKLPSIGGWLVWLVLGGAAFGYPALLWLDPLAIFSGFFGLFSSDGGAMARVASLALPAVLLLSLLLPGVWCGRICPLGALQEVLFHGGQATRNIFRREAPAQGDAPASKLSPTTHTHRRRLLWQVALGVAGGGVWTQAARKLRATVSRRLRPPGANPEETSFLGLCVRCGNCVRVCPSRIIEQDWQPQGVAGWLAPVLRFEKDYCREDCTRCMAVCPSGALRRPVGAAKLDIRIGRPRVDMRICLLGDDRECAACRNACPYEAITYVFSETDYTLMPVVDAARCPGCGACEAACPVQPVKAIRVFSTLE